MQQLADVLAKPSLRLAAVNFGWLMVERAARFVLNLLVSLLVARHLGPVGMGTLSYCVAVVTLLGFLPALGMDGPLKRHLLRAPESTAELLAGTFLLRLGAAVLGYGGLAAAVGLGAGLTAEERRVLLIAGLILFQPALFVPDLWMQAQLRAKWSVRSQLIALTVASATRLWLVLKDASVAAFAAVLVLEMVVSAVTMFWTARQGGLRMSLREARPASMRVLIRESWPLMFASLAIIIYMKIDEVMLRYLVGTKAVGTYAAAARLSEIWYFLPMALASSLLPELIRAREAGDGSYAIRLQQYYDVSATAGYALSVPIALLAPVIVRLAYGEGFAEAGPILAVHIWSSIFAFIGVARGQWLMNEGLQNFYLFATTAGAVSNVLLNFLFIPRWSGLGAAYATVISYALATWLASYCHPAVRSTAGMQARALMIPFRGWSYLRRLSAGRRAAKEASSG